MTGRIIIIDALIKVSILLVSAFLLPAMKSWLDRNRDNKELKLVLQMANIAVQSVENDLKTETGLKKKTEAISRLATQIDAWGLKGFTNEELNHYIETAVREMWDQELKDQLLIDNESIQARLNQL